jgi:hypothetical protein
MWLGWQGLDVIVLVFSMAIIWEMIEWKIENWKPYGSLRAWAEDTLMDLFLAIMVSIWIVL